MARPKLKNPPIPDGDQIKARTLQGGSTDNFRPVFCLQHLAKGFRISDCERPEKAAFADRLQEFAQLTWGDIKRAPRQGNGKEIIQRNRMIETPPAHISDDLDLIALRVTQKFRIVGYREDAVLHIVWVDPKHKVYKG